MNRTNGTNYSQRKLYICETRKKSNVEPEWQQFIFGYINPWVSNITSTYLLEMLKY